MGEAVRNILHIASFDPYITAADKVYLLFIRLADTKIIQNTITNIIYPCQYQL